MIKSVLFVCLGNICRSPMAESLLISKDQYQTLRIDSAGTGDWHVGLQPDHRTIKTLADHGLRPATRARQFHPDDFQKFDLIVAMDAQNRDDLLRIPGSMSNKVKLMFEFDPESVLLNVPDPYYGNQTDFDCLYVLLDRATDRLIENILE
jgi:protein-tyrosine phosphatase